MHRGYRATFVCVVAAVVLVALVPSASATAPGISVVFKGNGTYFVHQYVNGTNNGGCTLNTNDTFTLNWETDYMVAEPNPPDTRAAGSVPGKLTIGPGTFDLTGDATGGINCSSTVPTNCHGTLPVASSPPTMKYGIGAGDDTFNPQSFTLTSGGTPKCEGQQDQSESGLVNNDIRVYLDYVTASMMDALVHAPDTTVRASGASATVSNAGTPPSDCSSYLAPFYSPAQYSCNQTLSWTGTVRSSPVNPCANSQRACVDPQQKQSAATAAAGYKSAASTTQESYKGLNCGPGPGYTMLDKGNETGFACAALGTAMAYEVGMARYEQQIADDPPSQSYKKIASTQPPKVPMLGGPNTKDINQFDKDLAYSDVLSGAMIASVERAWGALDAKDESALKSQNKAAIADAQLATKTLEAAAALLPKAISQVGSIHERGYEKIHSFLVANKTALTTDAKDAEAIFTSFDAQKIA
jgi:hypothetical protein